VTDIDIDKLENMALLARSGFDWQDRLEMYKRELFRACPALIAELRRLRAIEAAAREVAANVEDDSDKLLGCVVVQPSREEWSAFKAALAAKETP
jgi:arginine/ornithine N-succinyltransferase beta subunit